MLYILNQIAAVPAAEKWGQKKHNRDYSVRYIPSSVCVRLCQLSQFYFMQYMGLCVFSLPISLKMIVRMCVFCPIIIIKSEIYPTVYPNKYAHAFVVLCFVVVMQSFIMNSHEVFIHSHHGCFAGTGAIVRLPQCQWSKPDGYGKISQCITTTKHSKAKTVCIFLGIYCMSFFILVNFV